MTPENAPSDPAGSPEADAAQALRRRAEALAGDRAGEAPENPEALSPEVARRAFHDLRVHQIELEMQNDELRRTQEELEASRARYFDLYDLAPVGYFTLSEQGLILEANLTAAKLLGVSRGALVKRPLSHFILPADQDTLYRHWRKLLERGASQVWELRLLKKDAAPFWARVEAAVAQEADGASVFRIVVSDITGRKQAEEEAILAHSKTTAILESISDGFCSFDREWRYTYANPAAAKMLSIPSAELLGKVVWELWPRLADMPFGVAFRRALAENIPLKVEAFYTEPLNRWFEVRCYPSSEGLSLLFNDTTEHRHAEERLRQTQKLESIGLLAGGIAHDFNNLLAVIMGNAGLALMELPDSAPSASYLTEIVTASERAAHLTRQMLAYAGKGGFVVEPIDLSQLVEEMEPLIHASIPKMVDIHLDLAPDLPPVEADPGQIRQLVVNLVVNGAEAIREGKPGTVLIRTELRELDAEQIDREFPGDPLSPGAYVGIDVRDTGMGMDEATKSKIFDPFFTTKTLGRGLGLAAVSGIVRAQKGAIQVYSSPGCGTSFQVLFPALAGHVAHQVPEASPMETPAAGMVVFVDDEAAMRSFARSGLEHHGWRVLLAENGAEGVRVFEEHQHDVTLVILDMTMPVMGGEEALDRMKAIRPDVPVIISTGYGESEAAQRFAGKDTAGLLQKPYTVNELMEKIAAVLKHPAQSFRC